MIVAERLRTTGRDTPEMREPPERCTTRDKEIKAYVAANELAAATELEEAFRQRLSLRNKVGRRYLGVLPAPAAVAERRGDRALVTGEQLTTSVAERCGGTA